MTNTENLSDLSDLNPTNDDLLAAQPVEDDVEEEVDLFDDNDDLDFDSNLSDDRYGEGRNGMPSWSYFS